METKFGINIVTLSHSVQEGSWLSIDCQGKCHLDYPMYMRKLSLQNAPCPFKSTLQFKRVIIQAFKNTFHHAMLAVERDTAVQASVPRGTMIGILPASKRKSDQIVVWPEWFWVCTAKPSREETWWMGQRSNNTQERQGEGQDIVQFGTRWQRCLRSIRRGLV